MKEKPLLDKPKASSSFAQRELDKAESQFQKFNDEVKEMTLDRMNEAPKEEKDPQIKISAREAERAQIVFLKPSRTVSCTEKFNEKFRKDYEFAKERVLFTAQNNEIIGETIELWTKKFAGQDAEFWNVPVNTVVEGPRYLAERIKGCTYHRLSMKEHKVTSQDSVGSYYGQMVVDNVLQRLDAHPFEQKKSIFMGASGF
jgi:hypothetical protein